MKILLFIFAIIVGCAGAKRKIPAPQYRDQLEVGEIVEHKAYTLSYNEKYEQPNWVAYSLKCSDFQNSVGRTNDYREDPLVKTKTLSPNDYKYTGYDRGHIAPAKDMSRNSDIMSESFYMSNISPQLPFFNRNGLWRKSESLIRNWACQNEILHIVAGPILDNTVTKRGLLSIPSRFYKVILADNKKMIGFIFPHSDNIDSAMNYSKTVDEVEVATGIDFFSYLPDHLEKEMESSVKESEWISVKKRSNPTHELKKIEQKLDQNYHKAPLQNSRRNQICCKICKKGKACGNSCIRRSYTCRRPQGCACDG